MSDLAWLFVAFMAVWIAIGAYLLSITARQKKLDQRLRDLES
ncbi:MAG: CcmD family protein [Actinomycetota bacterium]|nr:CcmD family protein [Actinomycetota bacterium]